jgi:hypothetical protein
VKDVPLGLTRLTEFCFHLVVDVDCFPVLPALDTVIRDGDVRNVLPDPFELTAIGLDFNDVKHDGDSTANMPGSVVMVSIAKIKHFVLPPVFLYA